MLSRIIQIEVHLWHYEYALSFDVQLLIFFQSLYYISRLESVENKKKIAGVRLRKMKLIFTLVKVIEYDNNELPMIEPQN